MLQAHERLAFELRSVVSSIGNRRQTRHVENACRWNCCVMSCANPFLHPVVAEVFGVVFA